MHGSQVDLCSNVVRSGEGLTLKHDFWIWRERERERHLKKSEGSIKQTPQINRLCEDFEQVEFIGCP